MAGNALQRQIANRLIKKIKKEHTGAQGAGGGTGTGTCGTRGLPNGPAGTGRWFGDGFPLFGYFWGQEDLCSALPTCWLSTSNGEPRAQEQGQGGSQQHPAGTTPKTGWQRRIWVHFLFSKRLSPVPVGRCSAQPAGLPVPPCARCPPRDGFSRMDLLHQKKVQDGFFLDLSSKTVSSGPQLVSEHVGRMQVPAAATSPRTSPAH